MDLLQAHTYKPNCQTKLVSVLNKQVSIISQFYNHNSAYKFVQCKSSTKELHVHTINNGNSS